MKHKLDFGSRAWKIGKNAEDLFKYQMEQKYLVASASAYQNMNEGWDFQVKRDRWYKIEVKAQKRIKRTDDETQNDLLWIEFSNGNGDKGWLYKQADYIAFQHGEEFWFIPRLKLVERAESLIRDEWVDSPEKALYKLYTRNQRHDILTLIKYEDIEDLREVW